VRRNLFIFITNPKEQELYNKIINKLEDLIKNQFINLPKNREILHSSKVLKVLELLRKNIDGQTIVFVDRVFTAAYLCQVLTKIDETIQVKYIAGSKMSFDEISCSLKYQVCFAFCSIHFKGIDFSKKLSRNFVTRIFEF